MTSFQVLLQGQWQNYKDQEDLLLKMALLAGQRSIVLQMVGDSYECDLIRMVQVNLRTGTERRMRAPVLHEGKVQPPQRHSAPALTEGVESQGSLEDAPSLPRRHSEPSSAGSAIMSTSAVVGSGVTAVPTVFRRQGHIREDRMRALLSTSEGSHRHFSGYPGDLLQHAKKAAKSAKLFVSQRHQKHSKQPYLDQREDKGLPVVDPSFPVSQDLSYGEFEDCLQAGVIGQRPGKERDRQSRLLAAVDTSFGMSEDVSYAEFEDYLQDTAVDLF